jgi:molybdopterin-guanine dinucleotide biosynthesis protein A
MTRDKALLLWNGRTLLDHTLSRLRDVCDSVRILCGPEPRYGETAVPVDLDAVPGAGPLGGVCGGLAGLKDGGIGLFLAIDLPLVPPALLSRLLVLSPGFDAVVPVTAAGPEPLCAVYRASCLESVRRRLEAGERKMTCFWADVRVREVSEAELADLGDPAKLFANVNTPEDFANVEEPSS